MHTLQAQRMRMLVGPAAGPRRPRGPSTLRRRQRPHWHSSSRSSRSSEQQQRRRFAEDQTPIPCDSDSMAEPVGWTIAGAIAAIEAARAAGTSVEALLRDESGHANSVIDWLGGNQANMTQLLKIAHHYGPNNLVAENQVQRFHRTRYLHIYHQRGGLDARPFPDPRPGLP